MNTESGGPTDEAKKLNSIYSERNRLAIAFVRMAIEAGWRAGRAIDDSKDWELEWSHVIYADLPDGRQVSWHMSPTELPLLEGMPEYTGKWDGTYTGRNSDWCNFTMPKDWLVSAGGTD